VRKDGAFIKLERLRQIKTEIVKGFPEPADYQRIVLWTEMNIGLSTEKALEYVNKLIAANGWVLDNGKIKPEV
jgi:hypothetical protein